MFSNFDLVWIMSGWTWLLDRYSKSFHKISSHLTSVRICMSSLLSMQICANSRICQVREFACLYLASKKNYTEVVLILALAKCGNVCSMDLRFVKE